MFEGTFYVEQWSDLLPRRSTGSIFLSFLHSRIVVGEFVLIEQQENTAPVAARILDMYSDSGSQFVLVNWFPKVQEALELPRTINNLLLDGQEVVQTNALEWKSTSCVKNICFVFHYDDIENGNIDAFGSKVCHFVRYKSSNGTSVKLDFQDHIPFWNELGASCSKRIWTVLSMIQVQVKKSMSRVAANQPTYFKLDIVNVMEEFWRYLQHTLSPHVPVLHVNKAVAMKIFWPDLKLETKKKEVDCYFLRIVSTPDLIKLRSIFGSNFGVGIKKKHPPAESPPVYCLHSDEVNIVVAEDTHPHAASIIKGKVRFRVRCPGFNFIYEPRHSLLTIQCRFQTIQASKPAIKRMVTLPHRDEVMPSTLVEAGETLFRNGLLYKVAESSVNGCFCVCIKDGTKTLNLSQFEAAAIIERQNN